MNNGNIIGAMAVGALLAPVTGGASLAVALAGVSAGSIISKMGEEDTTETTVSVTPDHNTSMVNSRTETITTPPTTANMGGDVTIAGGTGRAFVNGRLVRF